MGQGAFSPSLMVYCSSVAADFRSSFRFDRDDGGVQGSNAHDRTVQKSKSSFISFAVKVYRIQKHCESLNWSVFMIIESVALFIAN